MLWLQNGNVKDGRMEEFQQWVKKNEDAIRKYAPMGWRYRGTYATVLGFGRYSVTTMWECTKYGDFDALRNHDDPTWVRLGEEWADFFHQTGGYQTGGEATLLREIGDTKIIAPKEKKR